MAMEGSRRAERNWLGGANVRLLRESGVAVFASIRPDQITERLSDSGLWFLKRAESFDGEPMLFGRFVADTVFVHAEQLERPKKVLLLFEDRPKEKTTAIFAAMLYQQEDFDSVLGAYADKVNRNGLVVTDLRPEPVELGRDCICAVVVGPFRYDLHEATDCTAVENLKSAMMLGAKDELKSLMRLPVEVPVSTEPEQQE